MIKTLILGGGNAAKRYVESLIWDREINVTLCSMGVANKTNSLAKLFGLPCIDFSNLTRQSILEFDLIIITLPPEVKRKYTEQILNLGFDKTVILEKPLCINNDDLNFYKQNLNKFSKCFVVCQRDFCLEDYKIEKNDEYNIEFTSHTDDLKFNIINQLPHILSWLHLQNISFKNLSLNDNCEIVDEKNRIKIKISNKFVDYNAKINDIIFKSVNYRQLNAKIVKQIFDCSSENFKDNLSRAYLVSKTIINLLKKVGS